MFTKRYIHGKLRGIEQFVMDTNHGYQMERERYQPKFSQFCNDIHLITRARAHTHTGMIANKHVFATLLE